jgi:hypothetical protein
MIIIRWQGGWTMLCAANNDDDNVNIDNNNDIDNNDNNVGPLDSIDANPSVLNP